MKGRKRDEKKKAYEAVSRREMKSAGQRKI